MCSSTPRVSTPISRAGSATRRVASVSIASQQVCQSTPRCRASAETVVSSCSRASVAQPIARLVSFARGATRSCRSVNVPAGQAGSAHRQTRADHCNRTGTPKHGASATTRRRRPCPMAITPQDGHPPTSASDSTSSTSRSGSRRTASTCMPGTSNIASARAHQCAPGLLPSGPRRGLLRTVSLVASDLEGLDTPHRGPPRRAQNPASTTLNSEEPVMENPAWNGCPIRLVARVVS